MLDKYKVDAKSDNFALFVVRDNGGKRIVILLQKFEFTLHVIM